MLGIGLPIWKTSLGTSFNPATVAWTGWMRASYSGSPWAGTASTGTSGSHSFAESTNPPTTGTAVNGFTPAHFNGTNSTLSDQANFSNVYLSASAYSVFMLVKASGAAAPAANVYDNPQLFGTSRQTLGIATMGIAWSTSGVNAWHETVSGSTWVQTGWVAMSASAWHLVTVTYNGSNLVLGVDNVTSSTIAAGNIVSADLNQCLTFLGDNYNHAHFAAMDVLEVFVAQSSQSSIIGNLKTGYINPRYALSL